MARVIGPARYVNAGPVLVSGSRDWTDREMLRAALSWARSHLGVGWPLAHGGARGADELAGVVGRELGFEVRSYPAAWREDGRRAGPARNARLVALRPRLVLVFHDDAELGWRMHGTPEERRGRGTVDLCRKAHAAGHRIVWFSHVAPPRELGPIRAGAIPPAPRA